MRLLLVAPRYPWPPLKGDQLRTVQHLSILGRHHEVTALVPRPPAGAMPPPQNVAVEFYESSSSGAALGLVKASAQGWPYQAGLFYRTDLARALRRLAREADKVVFVLARLALHLPDVGGTPVVLDFVDSLALNFRRRALFDRPWARPFLRAEAKRLAHAERRIAESVERCLVVGDRDRWAMLAEGSASLGDRLRVVRLRVDLGGPSPVSREIVGPPALVVTGNLGYFPTSEGLAWWLREVWPLLRARIPELEMTLAGSRPPTTLAKLARRSGVKLVEEPDDLTPFLRAADIAIAPIRAGSGVPVKILEAWREGVPVVATPWAAEGAEARAGRECEVCSDPGEWVDRVRVLLSDPEKRQQMIESGRQKLLRDHAGEAIEEALLEALR